MLSPLVEAGLLPWGELAYEETLAKKQAFVAGAFARRGMRVDVAPARPSPRVHGARARLKFQVQGGKLGFYRPGTHDFVAPPLDALARPELVEAAGRAQVTGGEVELRSDGQRVVVDATAPVRGLSDVAIRGRPVAGDPTLRVDGLRVSPGSFYQVNLEVNRELVAKVDALLLEHEATAILDLYGGVGNLSRQARTRGTPVTLVENNAAAAADARLNLPGAVVEVADAARFEPGSAVFDVALLDPPRAGAPGLLPRVTTTRPRLVVYVSCDPVSLARDVALVAGPRGGYDVVSVTPFDMFPFTEHVETICVLARATRTSRR
jgi:23S rRNA (uracil1939-C5)-methyltransferase